MAITSSYWLTYNLGIAGNSTAANREDLLDLVTMIDPWDTPFFSSAPKTTVGHVTHEWICDALAATATGGAKEGDDFSAVTLTSRTRLNNVTQIFRKDILVSDTQRAVNPAGIRDEYEYQVMKGMRELARNIEARVWAAPGGSATGASGTERVMAAFADFLSASSTVSTIGSAITTANINGLMEQCYMNGGNPDSLYVSPGVKHDLTAAAVPTQFSRNLAAADKKLVMNVDVYESDFGLLAVIPDRWMRQASASNSSADYFLVERAKARIGFLRPMRHVPMGRGGDATRGIVLSELTLEILHPSAHIRGSGVMT